MKNIFLIKDADVNSRLDRWFKRNVFDVPQSLIEKSIRKGNIKVNLKKEKSSYKLKLLDKIIIKNLNFKKIIKKKDKNLVIGFGITSKNISSFKSSDGCVVGSEICKNITNSIKNRQNPVLNVRSMVKNLRSKILWTGLQAGKKLELR